MPQKKITTQERFDKVTEHLTPLKDHIPSVASALKWLKRAEIAALDAEARTSGGGPVEAVRLKNERLTEANAQKTRKSLIKIAGAMLFSPNAKGVVDEAKNAALMIGSRADLAPIAKDPTAILEAAMAQGWAGFTDAVGRPWSEDVPVLYVSPDLAQNTPKAIVAARAYARLHLGWEASS